MAAAARAPHPYRMKDLSELTGLSRQAIHFYIQQGLVPPGHKTGRNMAYYDEAHLERLQLIRRLQHERFLPLKAIRAILDDETGGFDASQRKLLRDVRDRLTGGALRVEGERGTADAAALATRAGVSQAELRKLAELGVLTLIEEDGRLRVPESDAWIIEHWGQMRDAGFGPELGFGPADLAIYEEAMSTLFADEKRLLLDRVAHLPADQVASMIERVLPLIHSFLARYHTAQVRNFFAAMD